jgi:hypothetical protein
MDFLLGLLWTLSVTAVAVSLSLFIPYFAIRVAIAVYVPLFMAYCMYWLPVWKGSDPSEYWSWAPIFIVIWSALPIIAGLMAVLATRNRIGFSKIRQPDALPRNYIRVAPLRRTLGIVAAPAISGIVLTTILRNPDTGTLVAFASPFALLLGIPIYVEALRYNYVSLKAALIAGIILGPNLLLTLYLIGFISFSNPILALACALQGALIAPIFWLTAIYSFRRQPTAA